MVLLELPWGWQPTSLEFYGKRYGLADVPIMLPDNFLLWPANPACVVAVTVGIPSADLQKFFKNVRVVSQIDDPWRVDEERNLEICVADTPIRDVREGWKQRRVW